MNDNILIPSDWVVSDEIIKVVGIGGGGCNAVNYMYSQKIQGCSFIVCNTDSQALRESPVPAKLQMGKGLGAGCDPVKGRNAALESQDEIEKLVLGPETKMLFITAGMGGGTGTGATPVIAKLAKDKGILTVAVVTMPFMHEGNETRARAIDGIHELERLVDSLLIINNEKLYEFFGDAFIQDAFPQADEVLATAVRGIVEIIKKPGFINVDFEDVKTMMRSSGMALMGRGKGSGPNRIDDAIREAFQSPLLNDFDLKSARNVLVNITAGNNENGLKMRDLELINQKINEFTGGANNFKRGLIWDDNPEGDTIYITAIATGFRFNDLIGPDVNLGKYIMIDQDFVYDRFDKVAEEGILLQGGADRIDLDDSVSERRFRYDADRVPELLQAVEQGNITEFENTSALRRKKKK